MRSGVAATHGDVVVIYDADRTYPLEDAESLVQALDQGFDVVTATPFGESGGLEGVPFFRRLLSQGAAGAYRLVLGRRAGDLNVFTCAFRAWRGDLLRALRWRSDGFPAAAEMFGLALLQDARATQRPSTLRSRTEGESKMRVVPTGLGHLGVLSRLLWARVTGS
jgi:dolichol-phosphate mannosyltransferase